MVLHSPIEKGLLDVRCHGRPVLAWERVGEGIALFGAWCPRGSHWILVADEEAVGALASMDPFE